MKKWKTLSTKLVFDNRWLTVRQDEVELPNGRVLDDYFVWVDNDVALVVPVTEDGNFVMVRQYKHAAAKILTEFPAGFIDKGEDALAAARRELAEETGFISDHMSRLATFIGNPTKATGIMYVFLAEHAIKSQETNFDDNEDIETIVCTPAEVVGMIMDGKISVTSSVAAAFMALRRLDKI